MLFDPPVSTTIPLSALDSRSCWIIGILLSALAGVGWIYLVYMAWAMQNMDLVEMWMPPYAGIRSWQAGDFFMLFSMWVLMMAAMMLPSTLPMVKLFATVQKKQAERTALAVTVFILAYLTAWAVYSLAATMLQWRLHESSLLNQMMDSRNYLWSGMVLIVAGLYQWTPLKEVCLRQCRSPLGFLMANWRSGYRGTFRMGLQHGFYCVGCCWALMSILFAVGVMNMLWIVVLATFALLEKTLLPPTAGRVITGLMLLLWGGVWLSLHFQ